MMSDEFEERAAIMEFDGNLPREWAEALARLATSSRPTDFNEERWSLIVEDAHAFVIEHIQRIVANGWTVDAVRALLPGLMGRKVLSVGRADVTVRMPSGASEKIFYRPRIGGAGSWDEGRRSA